MGGGAGGSFGNTRGASPKAVLDAISNVLTVASLIPGVDTFADLAAIPVDLLRGDYVSAGLDLVGAIPFIGEIADGAKTANRVVDAARAFDKASDSAKTLKKASNVVQSASPYKIAKTHRLTMSKKKYAELVESVRKNGITESIKYVEHNGTKYVVDGHHRLQVAKDLKLKNIPIEKVSLPYKGYKTIDDLLWFD